MISYELRRRVRRIGRRWAYKIGQRRKALRTRLRPPPAPTTLVIGDFDADPLPSVALIPLIHPEHPIVTDPTEIESHLERTLTSLAAQSPVPLPAVAVGHRVPRFAEGVGSGFTFVSLGTDGVLDPLKVDQILDMKPTRLDKGIKMLVARRVAAAWTSPEVLFTVDADDLLVRELVATVSECLRRLPDAPGVSWVRGLELAFERSDDHELELVEAIEIRRFNRRCGTCRALRASAFDRALARCTAHFADVLDDIAAQVPAGWRGGVIEVEPAVAARLDAAFHAMPREVRHELAHLGGHVSEHFALTEIDYLGAAKVCGHGQHIGPGRGEVHRQLAQADVDVATALALVGLQPAGESVPRGHTSSTT